MNPAAASTPPPAKARNKSGPKPEGGVYRVRLCGGGPWVRPETLRLLRGWRELHGVPVGRSLDAAVLFAAGNKEFFIPTK